MKAVTKKGVSILLAIIIALGAMTPFGLVSVVANAAEYSGYCGSTADGADGHNLQWSLDTATGMLSITGTGAMCDWQTVEDVPWFAYRCAISQVQIVPGVTSIGDFAFMSSTALENVNIPSEVTRIGGVAFGGCKSLESFVIPSGVTEIGMYAFSDSGLKSIIIPSGVKSIGDNAFKMCYNLETLTFEEGIESIGFVAFNNCTSLKEVELPASLKHFGAGVFLECPDLKITVNSGSKSFCSIDNVLFSYDKSVLYYYSVISGKTSYIVPQGVTRIAPFAFSSAPDLIALTIPDTLKVVDSDAFYNCYIQYYYYAGSEEQWSSTLKQYFYDLTAICNCDPDYAHYDGVKTHKIEIVAGKSAKAAVSVVPQGNISWRSNNSEIATVDENGRIKAVKDASGRETLVYAVADGIGITDIYHVKVEPTLTEKIIMMIFGYSVWGAGFAAFATLIITALFGRLL